MQLIQSIGNWGVKTYPQYNLHKRLQTPEPGDPVDFSLYAGHYPYENQFGRVDGLNKFTEGMIHICEGGASVFLNESGSVSISGGPFGNYYPDELIPTYHIRDVSFWNWGNNTPGADQGVHYKVGRPVFKLKLRPLTWHCPTQYCRFSRRFNEPQETVKCRECEIMERKKTVYKWEEGKVTPTQPQPKEN